VTGRGEPPPYCVTARQHLRPRLEAVATEMQPQMHAPVGLRCVVNSLAELKHMETLTKAVACNACTFWKPTQPDRGECHRHAPQAVVFNVDDQVRFESRFPVTAGQDWCGDFSQKGR
jgi:hypothetical protein